MMDIIQQYQDAVDEAVNALNKSVRAALEIYNETVTAANLARVAGMDFRLKQFEGVSTTQVVEERVKDSEIEHRIGTLTGRLQALPKVDDPFTRTVPILATNKAS